MTPTSFGLRVGSLSAGHTQAHLLITSIHLIFPPLPPLTLVLKPLI
jgi:hypothetical protein